MDTQTEKQIQLNLKAQIKKCTNLIIAHRLSTVIQADQILVIDQENIVEQGTHNDLMKKMEHYVQLWNV